MVAIARSYVPAGYELVVVDAGTPEFTAALADAAYYVGFPRPELNSDFFKAASGLKLVQLISAGYDRLDVGAAKRAGVPVANNGGVKPVGGGVVALLLVLAGHPVVVLLHGTLVYRHVRGGGAASARPVDGCRRG